MGKKLRVLFLTQYYPPETGAPQVRISEMARRFVERGFEVEVLTAMPNYPQGRVYDEYRGKWWSVEHVDGVRVIRAPIYPSRSTRLIPRLANYFSFVITSIFWGLFLARRPTVIVCESPPLFLGFAALVLKVLYWCHLLFNVSDLWPESVKRMKMFENPIAIRLAELLERTCYRYADVVTGQSKGIVEGVRTKNPAARVELIPNGCDCRLFSPERRDEKILARYGIRHKVVVGYAGLVGLAQGVGVLIEIAEQMREDDTVRFLVAGDGPEREKLQTELEAKRLPNIIFTGWLPKHDMPALVASFDIAFLPLRYYIPGALPSKLYEAMASETAVVLATKGGDAPLLLETAKAGIAVDYGDVEATTSSIRSLAQNHTQRQQLGRSGRDYVLKHHQRHLIADKMARVIESIGEPN